MFIKKCWWPKGRFPGYECERRLKSSPRKRPRCRSQEESTPGTRQSCFWRTGEEGGKSKGVSVLTGHGDGSGSGLPPVRPLAQSDVAGPAPFSPRNEAALRSPPLRARAPAPIGQGGARGLRGPRLSPGGRGAEARGSSARRGAGLPKQRVGSGGEKVGRVTWAGRGVEGAAGDVALSRARARDPVV